MNDEIFCEQSGRERWGCIHCKVEGTAIPDPDAGRKARRRSPAQWQPRDAGDFRWTGPGSDPRVVWVGKTRDRNQRCCMNRSHRLVEPGIIGNVVVTSSVNPEAHIGWACTECVARLPRKPEVERYYQEYLEWLEGVTPQPAPVQLRHEPGRVRLRERPKVDPELEALRQALGFPFTVPGPLG